MSQNQNPNEVKTVEEALAPILNSAIPFSDQRRFLHEMFTQTVCNAPDDEIDNYTARQLTPFYLALLESLENLEKLTLNDLG